MRSSFVALSSLFVMVVLPVRLAAQDLAVAKHSEAPPAELSEPIRALLAAGGVRATAGATSIDFWWVTALPLQPGSSGAPAWSQVTEGTIVGAVRLAAAHKDIRGRSMKAGVYTLRYGIQPANGDHLGVSPFRDFLLLSPAALDTDAAPISHDPMAELSGKSVGSSHPATWSIDPPAATEAPLKVRVNEAGHTAAIFEVPVARDGRAVGALRFGLILIGEIEA